MHGHAAFDPRHHLVLETNVGKGAPHHHFVIAAAGAVLIEIGRLHLVLEEVLAGRGIDLDRASRRDVVGGDGIEQETENPRIDDVGSGWRIPPQLEPPLKTSAYSLVNICLLSVLRMTPLISRLDGQMSLRKTFLPFLSTPRGCFTRSEYIEPASA